MIKAKDAKRAERRAKQQIRRQKQREANIIRVEKMHVARLTAASNLIASIPHLQTINIGCSGWFYWDWRGLFYPEDMPTKSWFSHYAKNFKTVELNAPFYSWPTLPNIAVWQRQAGRQKFIYTVKVSELITHIKRFTGTKTLVHDFGYIADLLGSRMGCFFFNYRQAFTIRLLD